MFCSISLNLFPLKYVLLERNYGQMGNGGKE